MRPSTASTFAILASTASAISSPRPLLLLSTHQSPTPLSIPQYAAVSAVVDSLKPYLSKCPTQQYLIVNQAGLHSSDIYDANTIPNLRRHSQTSQWSDRVEIGEVHDKPVDGDALATHIRSSCPDAVVETQYLHSLGVGDDARSSALADNDLILGETLSNLASAESLTLIYYGGAVDSDLEVASSKHQYVAEFPDDGSHIELKRQLGAVGPNIVAKAEDDDDEDWPAPPDTRNWTWFQRNYWLSEGQTVIIITAIMFSMLIFFAMKTVTGIVIPYGAFDTDYVNCANAGEKKKSH